MAFRGPSRKRACTGMFKHVDCTGMFKHVDCTGMFKHVRAKWLLSACDYIRVR